MTTQFPDRLRIDGGICPCADLPLEPFFSQSPPRPHFPAPNTALHRGYIATFAIRDNALWFEAITGSITMVAPSASDFRLKIDASENFVEAWRLRTFPTLPVLAGWFSGEIRVPRRRRYPTSPQPYSIFRFYEGRIIRD